MTDQIAPLFTWRSAICDSELSPTTRHVALTLALYMNERGGSAYPGPTRLARDTGLHVSTVKERLVELECAGWLCCIARGGVKGERKHANEYQADIPPTPLPIATGDPSPRTTGRRERAHPSPTAQPPVAHGDPITPLITPLMSSSSPESSFDRFWWYYPRKIAKGSALKAWSKATTRTSPETIVSASAAYKAHVRCSGMETKFIPHPATWLNRDSWDDDLEGENQPRLPRGADATARTLEWMQRGGA